MINPVSTGNWRDEVMAETTANAVADYIIRFYHEHGDLITNLKLHASGLLCSGMVSRFV